MAARTWKKSVWILKFCAAWSCKTFYSVEVVSVVVIGESRHPPGSSSTRVLENMLIVPCQNKIILKNFRPEPPPSVDRPKTILFQHGTTSEMTWNNFSMNIHEAVVAANRSIVYCNRQVPPGAPDDYSRQAAGERLNAPVNSAHDDTNTWQTAELRPWAVFS